MKKLIGLILAMVCCFSVIMPGTAMADAASGGEYNFKVTDFYVVVDAWDGYVNFRIGPGLEYGIQNPIYNGEVLHITETANNYYDEFTWGQTEWNGNYGWVSLHECSEIANPYENPTVPETTPQPEVIAPEDGKEQVEKIVLDEEKLSTGEMQDSFYTVIDLLKEMLGKAYAPYSSHLTGAVLVDTEGKFFTGTFIENSKKELNICAEEAALAKAVSDGSRNYKLLAVIGQAEGEKATEFFTPCKDCLDLYKEFVNPGEFYILRIQLDEAGAISAFDVKTFGKIVAESDN